MFPDTAFSVTIFLSLLLHSTHRVTAFPVADQALPPQSNNPNLLLPDILNLTTPSNDWENFAYPIPHTNQILKGRIFTSLRLRPSALHFMIDGGIAQTRHQLDDFGAVRLRIKDNPYRYVVPHCYFTMGSKVVSGAKPIMTYRMMRDVFLALEQVLENQQRYFEASFVLTDENQRSWGHGQVLEREPEEGVGES
ncbi:MAG: hypothetical protein Q9170_002483 [Blastenia crenularia]